MDYSDGIYFSRFAVDPESEFVDPGLLEDGQFIESHRFDPMTDELVTDLYDSCC